MRRWIAVVLVIGAGSAATGFYIVRVSDRKPVAASARIVHPERRMIANTVNATGTVRLRVGSEVRVGSQLSGIVKKLNVTVGSHVRTTEVIAEIDDATIQARLADAEFWNLTDELSEPNGSFRSDNFLSNETGYQTVIPDLLERVKPGAPGGVYLGVAPEINFSYIAAIKPHAPAPITTTSQMNSTTALQAPNSKNQFPNKSQ